MRRIEPPPDPRSDDPVLEPCEVVVVEAEMTPDGRTSGQVENLGRGHPAARHVEEPRDDAEQRVDLTDRAVGQAHPEIRMVGIALTDFVLIGMRVERGVDERRVSLDVRAHDEYVAWFEIGVILEQVQDRMAEHLDLAGPAVTRVDLDAPVRRR